MADVRVFWLGIVASLVFLLAGLFIHFGLGYALDTFLGEYPSGPWETSRFYNETVGKGGYYQTVNEMYLWGYVCYGLSILTLITSVWRRTRQDAYVYPYR